jgi:hypothetical protein
LRPLGEFGHEPAQGKVFLPGPIQQKGTMLAANCLRLVPTHFARQNAAGFPEAPGPTDHRADPNVKMQGCLTP